MSESFEVVAGSSSLLPEDLAKTSTLPVFSTEAAAFVQDLSKSILADPDVKHHPELVALAYWLRKSNLDRLQREFLRTTEGTIQKPRGTVFHIAPSNVDTIFVYSWVLSLLVGNRNIVRLPSKDSSQLKVLVNAVIQVLLNPLHVNVAKRNLLIRYQVNEKVTARLSSVCDMRVVWGGNETVGMVRKIPLPPHALEIAFCNKYSIATLNIEGWMDLDAISKDRVAIDFYNDAFQFGQMACSSPRLIVWVGERAKLDDAMDEFWGRVERTVLAKGVSFEDLDYVNKLVAQDSVAMRSSARHSYINNNDISRTWLDQISLHVDSHCGGGLFFETHVDRLDEINPVLTRAVQTLTYAGFKKDHLADWLNSTALSGIDRVVPFGQALSFEQSWDGFDLLRTFLRQISIH